MNARLKTKQKLNPILNLNNKQDGFTLVELLVSTVIISIVLSGLYLLIVQSFQLWKKTDTRSDIQQTVQAAVEEMTWDVRRATNNSRYPVIISSNPPAVRYYYVNGSTDYTFVRYRYSSDDKSIYRDYINSPDTKPTAGEWSSGDFDWLNESIAAENVSAMSLSPSEYVFTGASTSARSFRINVGVERTSPFLSSTGKESTEVYTKVELRNF